MSYFFFIGHSRENDDWALALNQWLAREGWEDSFLYVGPSAWSAPNDPWTHEFQRSTADCYAVLFLVSESWLASDLCQQQYRLATMFGKTLFALLIENISLNRLPKWMIDDVHRFVNLAGDPAECFEIRHPRTERKSSICISKEGLSRLKEGLSRLPQTVFISYSSRDQAEADEIVNRLEAAELKCWISHRDVPRGTDFQDAVVSALEKSSAMVLVFSKNADNSREIKKELALASDSGLFVLPVRIENTEPTKGLKYQLATRQHINLFEDRENNVALIVDALRKHLRTLIALS